MLTSPTVYVHSFDFAPQLFGSILAILEIDGSSVSLFRENTPNSWQYLETYSHPMKPLDKQQEQEKVNIKQIKFAPEHTSLSLGVLDHANMLSIVDWLDPD